MKPAALALCSLLFIAAGCANRATIEESASNREFVIAIARAIDDIYQARRQDIPEDPSTFPKFSAKAHSSIESAASRLDRYLREPTASQEPTVERLTYALKCFRSATAALDRGFLHPDDTTARADVGVGFSQGRGALMEAVLLIKPVRPPRFAGRRDPTTFVLTDEDARLAEEYIGHLTDRRLGELAEEGLELEASNLPGEVLSLTALTAVMRVRLQEEA